MMMRTCLGPYEPAWITKRLFLISVGMHEGWLSESYHRLITNNYIWRTPDSDLTTVHRRIPRKNCRNSATLSRISLIEKYFQVIYLVTFPCLYKSKHVSLNRYASNIIVTFRSVVNIIFSSSIIEIVGRMCRRYLSAINLSFFFFHLSIRVFCKDFPRSSRSFLIASNESLKARVINIQANCRDENCAFS